MFKFIQQIFDGKSNVSIKYTVTHGVNAKGVYTINGRPMTPQEIKDFEEKMKNMDEGFKAMDEGFKEMDKAFKHMDKLWENFP